MKLAEALIVRAYLHSRSELLAERLNQNAQYQEGEEPAESPEALLAEYRQAATKLEQLIVKINLANNRIQLESGQLMVEALAKRDRLKAEHNTLINLADAATQTFDRYSRSEIKTLAAIDVKNIRKQIDEIAKQHRQLDTQIQQANWLSEI